MTIYLNQKQIDQLRPFIRATFPDFTGQGVTVEVHENPKPMRMVSCWDGGYRDYFAVLDISTMQAHHVRQSGTMFDKLPPEEATVTPSVMIVEMSFRGSRKPALTLHVHPLTLPKEVTQSAPVDLSIDEQIVLWMTRHYKNSYGGESNLRCKNALRETTISGESFWKLAQATLQTKGYLNKAFSLTPEGQTVASNLGLSLPDHLRKERVSA